MSDQIPPWVTITASLVGSGLISSLITTIFERRKQNKTLQLEEIKKAVSLLREDFDIILDSVHKHNLSEWKPEMESSWKDGTEVWVSVHLCIPRLDEVIQLYFDARKEILMALVYDKNKLLVGSIPQNASKISTHHSIILNNLIDEWQRILGIKKPLSARFRKLFIRTS